MPSALKYGQILISVTDYLSLDSKFAKYHFFPGQITKYIPSCNRPPLWTAETTSAFNCPHVNINIAALYRNAIDSQKQISTTRLFAWLRILLQSFFFQSSVAVLLVLLF